MGHYEHLHPHAANYVNKSNEERLAYIVRSKWFDYPVAKSILDKMERLHNEPIVVRKESMLLYGESNNGKTAILKRFLKLHPPGEYHDDQGNIIQMMPVVYSIVPPEANESRLYTSILSSMCVPFREKDTVSTNQNLLEYYLKLMGTKTLLLDEIHNVLTGSFAKRRVCMNALKNLSNKLSISIVIAGIHDALSAVSIDEQIKSRFRPHELPIWQNNEIFAKMIGTLERTLPLKHPSNLYENKQLLAHIYQASGGRIGEAMSIIINGAINAIEWGTEKITQKELFSRR